MSDGFRRPRTARRKVLAALIGLLVILMPKAAPAPAPVPSSAPPPPFAAWLAALVDEAVHRGYERRVVEETLSDVRPLARVVRADRGQAEVAQSLSRYLAARVTPELVAEGGRLMRRHRVLLADIERAYGVDGRFVVAIWGAESGYGRYTGDVPAIEALVTLAWQPRRSRYFRGELFAALRMLAGEQVGGRQMVGSWAGAVGQPQFMPSSYLQYAVDFDGDGRRDLWHSVADTLASIANYLQKFGWRAGETWGLEVVVSPVLRSRMEVIPATRRQGCAALGSLTERRSLAEWAVRGVVPPAAPARRGPRAKVSLLALDGRTFLVGPNYEAILGYNCAHRYALSVSLLADAILDAERAGPRQQPPGNYGDARP